LPTNITIFQSPLARITITIYIFIRLSRIFVTKFDFLLSYIKRGGVKISSRIKYPLRKLKPNISLTYTRGRYLQIVDELLFKDDSKLLKIQSYLLLNDEL